MTNIPLPPQNRSRAPLPAPRRRPYTPPAPPSVNGSAPQKPNTIPSPMTGMPAEARRAGPGPVPVARSLPVRHKSNGNTRKWLKIGAGVAGLMTLVSAVLVIGVAIIGPANLMYGSGIASSVYAGGVAVGRLREDRAAERIAEAWSTVTLGGAANGERALPTLSIPASELGLTVDAAASAARAFEEGRSEGSIASLFADRVDTPLVVQVNPDLARAALTAHAAELSAPAVNAGVALVDGRAQATPPQNGLAVDVEATIAQWMNNPELAFANGTASVATVPVAPSVTDSSPLVAQADALLQRSLDLQVYDPVTGDTAYWSLPPEQWGNWLTANSDPNSPIGLSLQLSDTDLREYLTNQASTALDPSRTIDVEQGVAAIQAALAAGTPEKGAVILKHLPRTHVVQAGETMMTIGYDYGIPYLYISAENPGVTTLSVGQTINLPPADAFLLKPVVPNKRIVVSISEQRVIAYEDGAVKWDWRASTGIKSSPTWPGVYQVLEHHENAFAGNWQLWMPKFIGFYRPVPNSDFTNGFHGFPTRNGGQLLWESAIGTPVTYGCVLLNTQNIGLLYDWAEVGTVVEVLP